MTGSESQKLVPNPAQERAVAAGEGPVRILAGAGSGKTSTLVRRILRLIDDGRCAPDQILMLTFTRKATAEIRERVARALGPASVQPRIETYHAFAYSLVREYAAELGLPPDPVLLAPGPVKLFLRRRFDELGITRLDLSHLNQAVDATLDFFDWHRHEGSFLREPDALLALIDGERRDLLREFLEAHRRYRALLVANGAVDYDDLIAQAVLLLEGHPEVRRAVQEQYPFLMVDEYQDTDYLQGRLVSLLAGDRGNITIVGDPDQTIYGFRGATLTNILHFDRLFPQVEDIPMVINYRSTPAILAAANAVIAQNQQGKEEPLVAYRPQDGLPRPQGVEAPDWPSEAQWLAGEILRLHQEEGVAWRDVAVLVRLNRHKMPLHVALTRAGIPVVTEGGASLFDDPETARLIAYLQALAQPADDQSLALALTLPRYGLTDDDLAKLARGRQRGDRLLDACSRQAENWPAVRAFLDEFWPIYRLQHSQGCEAAIRAALRLHRSSLGQQARLNGEELLTQAREFFAQAHLLVDPADPTPPLGQFCEYLSELRDLSESPEGAALPEEEDAVRLLTVHAAKGLEFPVVFLPRLVEGDFPKKFKKSKSLFPDEWRHDVGGSVLGASSTSDGASGAASCGGGSTPADSPPNAGPGGPGGVPSVLDPAAAHLEEERRTFYVAVTRARDRLYLSWAPVDPARKTALERSCFLDEVGDTVDWRTLEREEPAFTEVAAAALPAPSEEGPQAEVNASAGHGPSEPAVPAGAGSGADGSSQEESWAAGLPQELIGLVSKAPARPLVEVESSAPFTAKPLSVLSFSHFSTYEFCPYRFFLTYVVRAPGHPATSADAGVRIHAAVERLGEARRAGEAVDYEQFARWAAAPELPEEADLEGADKPERDEPYPDLMPADESTALQNFWSSEYGQTVPLASEQEFYLRLGDVVIRGFIDRIQQRPDGTVEVVDFKTYKRALSEAEVRRSLQLPLYIQACRTALGYPQVDTGAMYFLKQDITIRVRYTDEELAERMQEAQRLADAIRAGQFEPTPRPQACGCCPYGEICPVSKAGE